MWYQIDLQEFTNKEQIITQTCIKHQINFKISFNTTKSYIGIKLDNDNMKYILRLGVNLYKLK